MDMIFVWNTYGYCWVNDSIEGTSIFIHKYPPTEYLVSIQHGNYITGSHYIFDSIHAAQTFIESKYNRIVKYRGD